MMNAYSRRNFCKGVGGLTLMATGASFAQQKMITNVASTAAKVASNAGDQSPPQNLANPGEVPRRNFGRSNVVVSAIALGGHTFATAKSKNESIQIVQEAVDNGITFMDNAWD